MSDLISDPPANNPLPTHANNSGGTVSNSAPSVSSSAPPPTWDEMASMFPDNTKRANRNRGSSAEPAPPTEKSSWLIVSGLVENATVRYYTADERADRGMCLSRWSANVNDARQYETREHADRVAKRLPHAAINPLRVEEHIWTDAGREKSSLSPVQEEATPTLDALTQAIELLHGKVEAKRASLASIEEGREANPEGYEHWRKFYSHGLPELIANESELRSLASALPGLLEASRERDAARQALKDANIAGIFDEFRDVPDALRQMVLHTEHQNATIADYDKSLSGSISERETLTAQNAELQKMLEQERRAHGG